jgi:hypothetical protein
MSVIIAIKQSGSALKVLAMRSIICRKNAGSVLRRGDVNPYFGNKSSGASGIEPEMTYLCAAGFFSHQSPGWFEWYKLKPSWSTSQQQNHAFATAVESAFRLE